MKHLLAFWLTGLITISGFSQVTFVIDELPPTTPGADTIFICGTFNNWNTNLSQYALTRQLDGRYTITLDFKDNYFEYKFTRGSFQKVETDSNNEFIANRTYDQTKDPSMVNISITNWVDLGGVKPINLWVFYFFTAGIIGLIISIVLVQTHKRKVSFTNTISTLTTIISVLLVGRAIYGVVNPLYQSYLEWLFLGVVPLVGPVFFLIKQSIEKEIRISAHWKHFILGLILLIIGALRIMDSNFIRLLSKYFKASYSTADGFILSLGLFYTCTYMVIILIQIRPQFKHWQKDLIKTNFWCISLICLAFVSWVSLTTLNRGFLFSFLSLCIFFVAYLFLRAKAIFLKSNSVLVIANSHEIIVSLQNHMMEQKPFIDSGLNINDLADQIGIKSHVLSKVLNEDIQQNFRDFVNAYRIEEFIKLSSDKCYQNYTFLALAHEVGFNSKSTFNNAFKRVTNQTPREYFKKENTLQ